MKYRVKPATPAEMRDPNFRSYAKSLAIGDKLIRCECGECHGEALLLPALTEQSPSTGSLVCPTCWHPLVGRMLFSIAASGGHWRDCYKKHRAAGELLADLGLLDRRGRGYVITPAGMAVLWVKQRVGWEFERAHVRGDYRTERFPWQGGGVAAGYWSNGKTGQWIHHRWASAAKVWPIKGVGVIRFESRAA